MTAEEEKYLCKFYTFFWKCRQSQFEYTAALITQKAICSHIRTLLDHILAKTTAKYSRNCLYTTTFSILFLWHNRCSVISGLQDKLQLSVSNFHYLAAYRTVGAWRISSSGNLRMKTFLCVLHAPVLNF